MVCSVYLAFVRICIEVKNYTLKSAEEVENIVRKQFAEGDEKISRNEFVSIIYGLCREGRVSPSILLNCWKKKDVELFVDTLFVRDEATS